VEGRSEQYDEEHLVGPSKVSANPSAVPTTVRVLIAATSNLLKLYRASIQRG
jgi:hypothetical protein